MAGVSRSSRRPATGPPACRSWQGRGGAGSGTSAPGPGWLGWWPGSGRVWPTVGPPTSDPLPLGIGCHGRHPSARQVSMTQPASWNLGPGADSTGSGLAGSGFGVSACSRSGTRAATSAKWACSWAVRRASRTLASAARTLSAVDVHGPRGRFLRGGLGGPAARSRVPKSSTGGVLGDPPADDDPRRPTLGELVPASITLDVVPGEGVFRPEKSAPVRWSGDSSGGPTREPPTPPTPGLGLGDVVCGQPLLPRRPLPVFHVQHWPHHAPVPAVWRLPPLEQECRQAPVLVDGHPTVT